MLPQQAPAELRAEIVELESSVEGRFSRHRGVVRGVEVDDTEIKRILRQSDDLAERREAWEASKTVGAEVADDVRRLARLRNEAARGLGYRDWFALSLAVDELDEGKLLETLQLADAATAEPFARWKGALDERLATRFGCAVSELRPWTTRTRSSRSSRRTAPSTSTACSRAATSWSSRAARSTGSSSTWRGSSAAATCIHAAASASTPSASTSTAAATSGCSRTSS
jgi:hypothetical protein